MAKDRLVPVLPEISGNVAAYTELISVAMHGISKIEKNIGDGNLGYIAAILLRELYPEKKLYIFGKNEDKLNFFSFADDVFYIDNIPEDLEFSYAFECVGGLGSEKAINQIIDYIKPQGTIAIMGVSENSVEINTRLVLEKGLTISGSSRSGRDDFKRTINFLMDYPNAKKRFENLVGIEKIVNSIDDVHEFFEEDLINSWGKSVMKWEM